MSPLRYCIRQAAGLDLPTVRGKRRLTVGLFGGSFNPPHQGHLDMSRIALRSGLDRVVWLVSPGNPLKVNQTVSSLDERMAACKALVRGHKRIQVAAPEKIFEERRSVYTVEKIQALYPSVCFVWVTGADCFVDLHKWHDWIRFMSLIPVLVVNRAPEGRKVSVCKAGQRYTAHRLHSSKLLSRSLAPAWALVHHPLNPTRSRVLRRQEELANYRAIATGSFDNRPV